MTLDWVPPHDDGGCKISGYIIEYKIVGAFKWSRANTQLVEGTNYTVKGLMEDMEYEFHVAAENKAGAGPFSKSSSAIKAKEPLGKRILFYLKTDQGYFIITIK